MSNKDKFVVQMYVLSVLWMIFSLGEGHEVGAILAMGAWFTALIVSYND